MRWRVPQSVAPVSNERAHRWHDSVSDAAGELERARALAGCSHLSLLVHERQHGVDLESGVCIDCRPANGAARFIDEDLHQHGSIDATDVGGFGPRRREDRRRRRRGGGGGGGGGRCGVGDDWWWLWLWLWLWLRLWLWLWLWLWLLLWLLPLRFQSLWRVSRHPRLPCQLRESLVPHGEGFGTRQLACLALLECRHATKLLVVDLNDARVHVKRERLYTRKESAGGSQGGANVVSSRRVGVRTWVSDIRQREALACAAASLVQLADGGLFYDIAAAAAAAISTATTAVGGCVGRFSNGCRAHWSAEGDGLERSCWPFARRHVEFELELVRATCTVITIGARPLPVQRPLGLWLLDIVGRYEGLESGIESASAVAERWLARRTYIGIARSRHTIGPTQRAHSCRQTVVVGAVRGVRALLPAEREEFVGG